MTPGSQSEIIVKLNKLLRHAESAREIGSIAEAEAFAARTQELLTKHKLEMSDIQFVEQEESEPIELEYISPSDLGIKHQPKRIAWQENLAMTIGHANDCSTLILIDSNCAFFVGRKSDREICVGLLRYFLHLIISLAKDATNNARDSEARDTKGTFRYRVYRRCPAFSDARL